MMKIQPSDRQGGEIRLACLSLYIIPHATIRIFMTVNRISDIKTVSSFRTTVAPVTFYIINPGPLNLPEGPFLFYRLSII